MEKRVTVNVKDSDIENVLNLIADQMGISYVIKKQSKSPYPLKSE